MFEARLAESRLLKQSIDAVSQLISECSVNLSKEGLDLKAMDSANVSMVDFRLLSGAFEKYEIKDRCTIGVSMEDLTQVLRRAKPGDSLVLGMKEKNRLEIIIAEKRQFVIPLLDLGEGVKKTPQLNFPATLEVRTEALEEAITDAEIVSDAIIFEADREKFVVRAEGDGRKAEVHMKKGSEEVIGLDVGEKVHSMFPLEYLKKIVKGARIADTAKIFLGNDYPLKVTAEVKDQLSIAFILAPRIETS